MLLLWELLQRAWRLFVAAMGTTTLAIMVAFAVIPILLLLLEWSTKGWTVMKQRWQNNLRVVGVTLAVWVIIFSYQLFVAVPREINQAADKEGLPIIERRIRPPEIAYSKPARERRKFTTQELADFGTGIAIQIVEETPVSPNKAPEHRPLATGFWVSTKGYAVTCAKSISGHQNRLVAAVPMPPLLGQNMIVAGGGMFTRAELVATDEQSGLALLRVYLSPFERQMHSVALAKNLKTGKVENSVERYWVPKIATIMAQSGDEVVRIGFTSDSLPVISPDFGHINRANVDTSKSQESFRLYTSLPFKESNCGAPIINDAKEVVGVIGGVDPMSPYVQPREFAVPAKYVLDLLKHAQIDTSN
jgi:hypothetical protein